MFAGRLGPVLVAALVLTVGAADGIGEEIAAATGDAGPSLKESPDLAGLPEEVNPYDFLGEIAAATPGDADTSVLAAPPAADLPEEIAASTGEIAAAMGDAGPSVGESPPPAELPEKIAASTGGAGPSLGESPASPADLLEWIAAVRDAGPSVDEPPPPTDSFEESPPQGNLLDEIVVALGSEGPAYYRASRVGLPKVHAGLARILPTLPRSERGRLDGPAVRYALYHFFVREYGWRIKGLDPMGGAWNSSSPSETAALKRMPEKVQALLAKQLDDGLDERGLSILAWTLRYLVQEETDDRLLAAYTLLGLPVDSPIQAQRAEQVLDWHMASHVAATDLASVTPAKMKAIYSKMDRLYPSWNDTVAFIHDTFVSERGGKDGAGSPIGFDENRRVLSAITERYGLWQDTECQGLKAMLLPLEDQGSGRVPLPDFYRASLGGKWQFSESAEYLRRLGALDETVPGNPRVVIVNYLLSNTNCVGSTAYNELCCISECEALMSHVESSVAAPAAEPGALMEIVSALPSSTVPAGRQLDAVSQQRLWSIAAQHGGAVPISGRLFAQWMHHAHPRECPYPHTAGATEQLTHSAYMKAAQAQPFASSAEMESVASRPLRRGGPRQTLPWDRHEEVLAPLSTSHGVQPVGFLVLHLATAMAMLMLLGGLVSRTARRRSSVKAAATMAPPMQVHV